MRRRGRAGQPGTTSGSTSGRTFDGRLILCILGGLIVRSSLLSALDKYFADYSAILPESNGKDVVVDQIVIDQVVAKATGQVVEHITSDVEERANDAFKESLEERYTELVADQVRTQLYEMFGEDAVTDDQYFTEDKGDDSMDEPIRKNNTSFAELESKPKIPNLLVGGVQRGGTTALSLYLHDKYSACLSDTEATESSANAIDPHFFDDTYNHQGIEYYQSLFQKCHDSDLIIDDTPDTMLYPERVRSTYEEQGMAKEVKIIFTLREPMERELSSYYDRAKYAHERDAPQAARDLIKGDGTVKTYNEDIKDRLFPTFRLKQYDRMYGYYAMLLKRWFTVFDRSQILVLSYDELKTNETSYLERVHKFLNIPIETEMILPARAAKKPEIDEDTCKLQHYISNRFFARRNTELYQLLEEKPGPGMELRPFPKFQIRCVKG